MQAASWNILLLTTLSAPVLTALLRTPSIDRQIHHWKTQQIEAIGSQAYERHDLTTALAAYQTLLRFHQMTEDLRQMREALNSIVVILCDLKDYTQAYNHAKLAVHLANRSRDPAAVGDSLNILGAVCRQQHRFHEAIQHYRRSLQKFHAAGQEVAIGQVLNNLGIAYGDLNDYERMKHFCLAAASVLEDAAAIEFSATALCNAGIACFWLSDSRQAAQYLEQALVIWLAAGKSEETMTALAYLERTAHINCIELN